MAGKSQNGKLTITEQKSTATYKLLTGENETLQKSLKKTQNQLEEYRTKFHEADKSHAILSSKNGTVILHEILKFLSSGVCAAVGVNFVTGGDYWEGAAIIVVGVISYGIIVFFDNKK